MVGTTTLENVAVAWHSPSQGVPAGEGGGLFWKLTNDPGTVQVWPLAAGRVQLAWSEFEVVDTQLAVRLTRLT